jgi:hypothetical protein
LREKMDAAALDGTRARSQVAARVPAAAAMCVPSIFAAFVAGCEGTHPP